MAFWSGLLKGIGALAGITSGGAKGAAEGRMSEAELQLARDNQRLAAERDFQNSLMDRSRLDMEQRQFSRSARGSDASDALRGALLKNLQDAKFDRPEGIPMISMGGGLRPSALGVEGREVGDVLNQRALAALLAGEKFAPLPALQRVQQSALPKAGFWEKLLGGAGLAGSIIGGINAVRGNGASTPQQWSASPLPEDTR